MLRAIMIAAVGLTLGCGGSDDSGDDGGGSGGTNTSGGTSGSGGTGTGGTSTAGGSGGTGGSTSKGGSSGATSNGGSSGKAGKGGSGGAGTGGGGKGGSGTGGGRPSDLPPGDCALEAPAFCEKFETAHPGGRGGDLDESIWSFGRWNHLGQYFWFRLPSGTKNDFEFPATFCGEEFSGILPPDDVKVCDGPGVDGVVSGQLNEVFDDQGDFAFQSMRIRQPFDFAGREGRIAFDVDGKLNPYNEGHGWWIEVWVTPDPTPLPYHEAPSVTAIPRAGIGFVLRFGQSNCEITDDSWGNAVEAIVVADNYEILHWFDNVGEDQYDDRCFRTMDAKLNHFEIRLTQDRAEFWASDYEDPASFKLRAIQENLDLSFTRGYVHFQHSHYNASKDGNVTPVQTFRWDNIGFDGPVFSTPRGYDVPENDATGDDPEQEGGVYFGWYINDGEIHGFTAPEVDLTDAVSATFNFNVLMEVGQELEYRFNGGEWHSFILPPGALESTTIRSFSLDAPLAELVDGDNLIEVRVPELFSEFEGIGNLDLTIEVP